MGGIVWSFWQWNLELYSLFERSPLKGLGKMGFFTEKDVCDWDWALRWCVDFAVCGKLFSIQVKKVSFFDPTVRVDKPETASKCFGSIVKTSFV